MRIPPSHIKVRFADVDMMSHVNNAVYLSYFETARMDYLNHLLGKNWDWQKKGIILLRNEIDYIKPVLLEDEPIILIHVTEIGNKSFALGYELKVRDELYTKGISKLVAYDYTERKAVPIHAEMRAALEKVKQEQ